MENEAKKEEAIKLYQALQQAGVGVILDDRENLSIGVKIKDCKVLGTPYMAVLGDKVEAGMVELEDVRSGEKEVITIDALIQKMKTI